jgi:hypothetical protein
VRNALVAPLVQRLREPVAAPPGAGSSVEPLGWLLREIGAGISLTRTERLPRPLAIKAAERFGWPHGGPEIAELYDLARRAGAVRRSAHRLFLTQTGHRLVAMPNALWRAAAAELAPGEHGELVLVLMLSSGAASIDGLAEQVGDAGAVHAVLRPARLLGVVTVAGSAVTLTDLGRAAALVALQRRATGQYPGAR